MTHTTLQTTLALTGAALSAGVAVGGLAIAPRHVVHRIFAVGMGCLALTQLCSGLGVQSLSILGFSSWEYLRLLTIACLPGVGLLFSLSFARFNPWEHVRQWRWGIPLAFGLPLGLVVGFPNALYQELSSSGASLTGHLLNPVSLGWSGYGFYMLLLMSALIIVAHLEKTLRASAGTIRAQIKFMILGMGFVFAVQVYTTSQTLFSASRHTSFISIEALAIILASVSMIAALLRRHRFDVQLYVARSFPFYAVSLKVAALYLLLAVVLPQVFHTDMFEAGDEVSMPSGLLWGFGLLIAGVVVCASDLVRYEIRRFLNRYVFRARYDYRHVWSLYTQRMASVVDTRELCHVIARLVSDTFGVPAVTVWLFNPEAQNPLAVGGSTVSWDREKMPSGWEETIQALMTTIRQHTMPVNVASPLRQGLHVDQRDIVDNVRIRYGVALVSGQAIGSLPSLRPSYKFENR